MLMLRYGLDSLIVKKIDYYIRKKHIKYNDDSE